MPQTKKLPKYPSTGEWVNLKKKKKMYLKEYHIIMKKTQL